MRRFGLLLAGLTALVALLRDTGAQDKAGGVAPIDTTRLVAAPGTLGKAAALARAPNPWVGVLERTYPSVVKVYGAGGFVGIPAYGSGVVVDARGFIATAWSVALDARDALKVVTHAGRRHSAVLWRSDPARGIAVLKVEGLGLPALPLAPDVKVGAGDTVLTIGNAFDVAYGEERSACFAGCVTAVGALDLRLGIEDAPGLRDLIVVDAPNNPGTQGGPLLDREGRLIGILGRLVESKATNTQVHFAVPASGVATFVREAAEGQRGRPAPPVVETKTIAIETGIRLLDAHLSRSPPAYIERVLAGSPAEKAGLAPDDLIFRADGRVVRSCRAFEDLLRGRGPGEKLRVVVKRGDRMLDLELELAARGKGE